MKNIVGQIPRGENFFRRDKLVKKIYRRLDAGENVYLAAPRRVGKSSIMRFFEDNPAEGYHFLYVITESIQDAEEFFKELMSHLFKSDVFNTLIRASKKLGELLSRIKSLNLGELGLELNAVETSYFEEFRNLVKKLETIETKIVIRKSSMNLRIPARRSIRKLLTAHFPELQIHAMIITSSIITAALRKLSKQKNTILRSLCSGN